MIDNLREYGIKLALQAGEILLDIQSSGRSRPIGTKLSHMDLVTAGDLAAEALLTQAIRERFPDHGIHAEESAQDKLPDTDWTWFIDPVDGTTNYAHGLPLFAINVGVAYHGEPVLGITHAPALEATYWAEAGGGAWLRRRGHDYPISVSDTADLGRALLGTGYPYDRATNPDSNLVETLALDIHAQGLRRLGTAALELAWVASGALDVFWQNRAQIWDWIAGAILVREAGGIVTDYAGQHWQPGHRSIIACNGQAALHAQVQSAIADARRAGALA